jgi:hypothetical protein
MKLFQNDAMAEIRIARQEGRSLAPFPEPHQDGVLADLLRGWLRTCRRGPADSRGARFGRVAGRERKGPRRGERVLNDFPMIGEAPLVLGGGRQLAPFAAILQLDGQGIPQQFGAGGGDRLAAHQVLQQPRFTAPPVLLEPFDRPADPEEGFTVRAFSDLWHRSRLAAELCVGRTVAVLVPCRPWLNV